MNRTIELICQHASVRDYTGEPISQAEREAILAAARATSSSSFLQLVSIVRVTRPDLRAQLAHLSGEQTHVATAAEFWVFCADFYRNSQIADQAKTGYTEQLLLGSIDTAMMAQNALTAAESLGLGGVFIGGIRNQPDAVSELLGLPDLVVPLFGLCLGHPAGPSQLKPRLPLSLLLHEDAYQTRLDQAELMAYDQTMQHYYAHRATHAKQQNWTGQIKAILSKESRPFMLAFLQKKGFLLR